MLHAFVNFQSSENLFLPIFFFWPEFCYFYGGMNFQRSLLCHSFNLSPVPIIMFWVFILNYRITESLVIVGNDTEIPHTFQSISSNGSTVILYPNQEVNAAYSVY
jgi:hypothetical protein